MLARFDAMMQAFALAMPSIIAVLVGWLSFRQHGSLVENSLSAYSYRER